LTSFPETLAGSELGRKQVLDVEDWAEIRVRHEASEVERR
jgi:hypothetical protein